MTSEPETPESSMPEPVTPAPVTSVPVMPRSLMPEPAQRSDTAIYFNGRSSRKRTVTLSPVTAGIQIVEEGALVDVWPYANVRRADGPRELLRLRSLTALPLARLEIADAAMQAAIAARCPSLDLGEQKQTWRIVSWSLAAVTSIVLLAIFVVPVIADRLVPFVPQAFERRLGDAVDKQAEAMFGGKRCTGAEGQAAFSALIDKLKRAGDLDVPLSAAVLASRTPNAFALPGGKVFLLDGLLQKADSPDEIAGVLAHELGHVKHRDHLRQLIRTGGTSFLFGLLFGDVSGAGAVIFTSRTLLNASYSREAEQGADDFAIDVMHKLGRSPKPMGDLLLRVTGAQANKSYTILASHPMTEARRAEMIKEDRPNTGAALLSVAQWQALKTMCQPALPVLSPALPNRSGQGLEQGAGRIPRQGPGQGPGQAPVRRTGTRTETRAGFRIGKWRLGGRPAPSSRPLDFRRVAAGRGEMDVQVGRVAVGELPLDRLFQEDSFDQLPAGHHALVVEAAHRQRAPAQLDGHAADGIVCLFARPHVDGEAHAVGRGDGVVLVVGEDHLVARRSVGEADAAGIGPVGFSAQRAARGELGVRQREQMRELFGRQAGDAEGHGILLSLRRT